MILIVLAALSCQHSFADTSSEDAGIQAALDARNEFVTDLKNKDFESITHQGMDYAIQELAAYVATQYNDQAMSADLLNQWNAASSANFADLVTAELSNKDLGDHPPLFPWLNDYIAKLADKYGSSIVYALPIIKDIQTLNFAIPVVFSPRGGKWEVNGVDSRIEYRKHFIPFANIITYYVTLYGCKYEIKKHGMEDLKKICSQAATKLEFYMGRYIAPVVSDWIFKEANSSLTINASQLHYTTVEQLRAAIQN
jgi:hypothetical protein